MNDKYNLERFVKAQENTYAIAEQEIRNGKKESHWMWYIFPQFFGLGQSETSKYYAIKSLDEAIAYMKHPVLGKRMLDMAEAVIHVSNRELVSIFGELDAKKFISSMTLFYIATRSELFYHLVTYFNYELDEKTIELVAKQDETINIKRVMLSTSCVFYGPIPDEGFFDDCLIIDNDGVHYNRCISHFFTENNKNNSSNWSIKPFNGFEDKFNKIKEYLKTYLYMEINGLNNTKPKYYITDCGGFNLGVELEDGRNASANYDGSLQMNYLDDLLDLLIDIVPEGKPHSYFLNKEDN